LPPSGDVGNSKSSPRALPRFRAGDIGAAEKRVAAYRNHRIAPENGAR
jgi:hypothetical protein